MNKYLLDTNICIHLLKNEYQLKEKISRVGKQNCFISAVTFTELLYGAENSQKKEANKQLVYELANEFGIIPFEVAIAEFAKQKVQLKSIGRIVGDFDILIGSTAIALNMVLVTRNVKDFEHLTGIVIENWIDVQKFDSKA